MPTKKKAAWTGRERDQLRKLKAAARGVIKAWDGGDLAAAVRKLDAALGGSNA